MCGHEPGPVTSLVLSWSTIFADKWLSILTLSECAIVACLGLMFLYLFIPSIPFMPSLHLTLLRANLFVPVVISYCIIIDSLAMVLSLKWQRLESLRDSFRETLADLFDIILWKQVLLQLEHFLDLILESLNHPRKEIGSHNNAIGCLGKMAKTWLSSHFKVYV